MQRQLHKNVCFDSAVFIALLGVTLWGCSSGTTRPADGGKERGPAADIGVSPDLQRPDTLVPDQGPTAGSRCQSAQAIYFAGGVAKASGSTNGLTDEFATLKCDGQVAFAGPQAYYKIDLRAGESYKITLETNGFEGYVYVFSNGSACKEAAIENDCGSRGQRGAVGTATRSGQSTTLAFKAHADDAYYIVVDSASSGQAGPYTLTVTLDCSALQNACNDTSVTHEGKCASKPKAGGVCDDGNACTINDSCQNGLCLGTPMDCSAQSDACNVGSCVGGQCVKQPKASGSCSDGDSCTINDQCVAGVCKGTPKDCAPLGDSCNDGVCVAGTCLKQPKSGSCSDLDACTVNDKCVAGSCVGTPLDCSAQSDQCNTGVCTAGGCVKQPKSGACNDNDPCTTNDQCVNGTCVGTTPTDLYEPNNTYYGRHLTDTSDCNSLDYSLTATLFPAGDEDWYWFKVTDNTGCDVEPRVTLSVPSGVNYELCAYFECNNGNAVDLTCLEGTLVTGPKAGSMGCCATTGGSASEAVRLQPTCSWLGTGDESGYVDVRVYSGGGYSCQAYTLQWGDS